LYGGIYDFKNGYHPRTNIVKDEKCNLVANCHSILAGWRNYFSQLLNVHEDNNVRHSEIHAAEPLVPKSSASEIKMTIEKLKRHNSPGVGQIPAELIKAGGRTICSKICTLINSIWNRKKLAEQWKELITVPICKTGDKTDCSNYHGISLLSTTYKILSDILLSRLTPYAAEIIGF
jgi:hypothetical protein